MKKRTTILLLFVSLATFVAQLCLLPKLPDIIPTHWNFAGEVDGYSSKYISLLLAALPLFMLLLLHVVPKIDPRGQNYAKHEKAYSVTKIFSVLFMSGLVFVTDAVALGYPLKVEQFVSVGIGIMFIAMGNYMPQIRSNYSFGIKTPWAIHSEWVWKKTHAMGGIVFIVMGLCFLLFGILRKPWLGNLAFAVTIGGTIWLYIYSYLLYKKELKNGQEN